MSVFENAMWRSAVLMLLGLRQLPDNTSQVPSTKTMPLARAAGEGVRSCRPATPLSFESQPTAPRPEVLVWCYDSPLTLLAKMAPVSAKGLLMPFMV